MMEVGTHAKQMRKRVLRSFLRYIAKTVPQNEDMNRQLLYRLLLINPRFMNQILDASGQQWIRLFLRQWDIIFDCSAFGLIDCGQKFRIDHAINLIRIYQPKTVEVVLIGRNLHFNDLKQFLVKLKPIVPSFTTTHHKTLTRFVQAHQRILLETLANKLTRVELFENQLPYLHRDGNCLEKCVVHCKSSMGFGQLSLVLKTRCRVLVGRYRISEFFECRDCDCQPNIEELQLINDDAAWQVFCQPDASAFFDLLMTKLPNLKKLVLGMSERLLLRGRQQWKFNCVDDLVMQLINFNSHQFLNKNYDLREHCRSMIQNVYRYAKQLNIELYLCYDTNGMYSIYETPKLYPIAADLNSILQE